MTSLSRKGYRLRSTAWVFLARFFNLAGIAAAVICAANEQWLPAIFALLVRKELVAWMNRRAERLAYILLNLPPE